jgi:hypothetical protein
MMWPQITVLILLGLRLVGGNSQEVGAKIVGALIFIWLLYAGGFWAPLLH